MASVCKTHPYLVYSVGIYENPMGAHNVSVFEFA